jgi:hypothetical protein
VGPWQKATMTQLPTQLLETAPHMPYRYKGLPSSIGIPHYGNITLLPAFLQTCPMPTPTGNAQGHWCTGS